MKIPSTHCEARLKGIAKRHDKGGDYAQITLQVQPVDLPDALWKAPLGSIWMVAFARVGDDGEPQQPEQAPHPSPHALRDKTEEYDMRPKRTAKPFADMPPSQQAGMLCKVDEFQRWVCPTNPNSEVARDFILVGCGVYSRKTLDENPAARRFWEEMLDTFHADTGRTTEQRG